MLMHTSYCCADAAQHGLPVTHVSFFPGKATSLLLSADRRGRMVLHSFSNLLLRTSVSSKVLVEGQYGAVLAVQHLAPFVMPPLQQTGAVPKPPVSPGNADDAAKRMFYEVRLAAQNTPQRYDIIYQSAVHNVHCLS